jgi:NAD(P)-dependent dehydrogenase (short-subunit alcohol dehydrogenase family)
VSGGIDGKVIIVTGSASGLGAASAKRLASEGAQVVVADINLGGAEEVVASVREMGGVALACHADVGDPEQVRALVEQTVSEFGKIDGLVNVAALLPPPVAQVADIELDGWEHEIRVSLTGSMLTSKYVLPHMIAGQGGTMVHFASAAGVRAMDNFSGYGVVKAGVIALSRAIAVQYGKAGIRSNVIAPGAILSRPRPQEFIERALDHAMTAELGTPEDIAAAVYFFSSDESKFVTAQVLMVDGGSTMRLPNLGRPSYREPEDLGIRVKH